MTASQVLIHLTLVSRQEKLKRARAKAKAKAKAGTRAGFGRIAYYELNQIGTIRGYTTSKLVRGCLRVRSEVEGGLRVDPTESRMKAVYHT